MVSVERIIERLAGSYGDPGLHQGGDPLAVLIHTILSHNTSDQNSRRAFDALAASYSSWEDIAEAGVEEIAAIVRTGGLGEIKARRITAALREIARRRGRLELDFLDRLSIAEAGDWLKQLPGVGTKTAHCVLLFALGKSALPVDTHIYRVAMRLGLIDSKASVEQAHRILGDAVSPGDVYRFHVLMIAHGRTVCRARRPRCAECVLCDFCPRCGQPR